MQHTLKEIDPDDVIPSSPQFQSVPTGTAAHVQNDVIRVQPQVLDEKIDLALRSFDERLVHVFVRVTVKERFPVIRVGHATAPVSLLVSIATFA
jgi:hypothetical protein